MRDPMTDLERLLDERAPLSDPASWLWDVLLLARRARGEAQAAREAEARAEAREEELRDELDVVRDERARAIALLRECLEVVRGAGATDLAERIHKELS